MKPELAYSLYRAIGVNTHVDYPQGVYANTPKVIDCINATGIKTLRDCPFQPTAPALWKKIGDATGARWCAYMNNGAVEWMQQSYKNFPAIYKAGIMAYAEGGNENDSDYSAHPWTGTPNSIAATQKQQAILYKDFNGKVPVINMSLGGGWDKSPTGNYGNLGDMTKACNLQNTHDYPQNMQTAGFIIPYINNMGKMTGSNPIAITEYGVPTLPANHPSAVPEDIQAIYLMQALLSFWPDNPLFCLFELLDQKTGDADKENNFGLFHSDYSEKPIIAMIRNLMGILATAKDVPLVDLDIQITGQLPSHKIKLLQLDTDKYLLAAWREEPLYDSVKKVDLRKDVKDRVDISLSQSNFSLLVNNTPILLPFTNIPDAVSPAKEPTYTLSQLQAALDYLKGQKA